MTAVELSGVVSEDESHRIQGKAVVIGGGNVAIDAARTSGRCGASEVSMYCLESRDIMPASDEEMAEAEDEGVTRPLRLGTKGDPHRRRQSDRHRAEKMSVRL